MTIDEVLKVTHSHYRIVQVIVYSPDIETAAWTGKTEDSFYTVVVVHSDGQYGGGRIRIQAATMERALGDCVRIFHHEIEKLYQIEESP